MVLLECAFPCFYFCAQSRDLRHIDADRELVVSCRRVLDLEGGDNKKNGHVQRDERPRDYIPEAAIEGKETAGVYICSPAFTAMRIH